VTGLFGLSSFGRRLGGSRLTHTLNPEETRETNLDVIRDPARAIRRLPQTTIVAFEKATMVVGRIYRVQYIIEIR
jgi:hypothetical protein